jgi:hypothetical protein
MSTALDLSEIPEECVRELHRQAETCLAGTVQLALGSDQRATLMAGMFGAASVALLAAIATLLAASKLNTPFIGGAAAMALSLFIASIASAMAAAPTDFHVGGYEPKRFARSAANVEWMLRYATEDMQARIDKNREVLERSSGLLRTGMFFAGAAIPFGIVIFGVVQAGLRSS